MPLDAVRTADPTKGIVIGSILVEATKEPDASWLSRLVGRKADNYTYAFEVIRVDSPEPAHSGPYADRYVLEVEPGTERIFTATLPTGEYWIRSFEYKGLTALGGRLPLMFRAQTGESVYIGRLVLEFPAQVTLGSGFTFRVEDARDRTLKRIPALSPKAATAVRNAPMVARPAK